MSLLSVRDLRVAFPADPAPFFAVDGLSFSLDKGEVFALVGESGCGKSLTAQALMGLLPSIAHRYVASLTFDGRDLQTASAEELRALRGREMAMVFQEPMTSLNPVFTIGDQVAEMLTSHEGIPRREALRRAVELLGRVQIPAPEERIASYPHQLSGGMRQRVMIAMAIACGPALLIADEPTTALDVTIQAQVLDLLLDLRRSEGLGILFITHDLGVVAQIADRVLVMYAGVGMEEGTAAGLFRNPRHPYTRGLLGSVPRGRGVALRPIEGTVPDPGDVLPGCRFAPRCPEVRPVCTAREPEWRELARSFAGEGGHMVRCARTEEL